MLSGNPIWVSNTDDSGAGSLRAAIEQANETPGQDTIKFRPSSWDEIELSSQLLITDDLVIQGPGAENLTVSGGGSTRVFLVLPAELADDPLVTPSPAQLETAPEVTIRKLTIAEGLATDAPGNPPGPFVFGGGIYNLGGTVHVEQVEMRGNTAVGAVTAGGAIANEFGGTLTVSRSQFAENLSDGALIGVGGAITSDLGPTAESRSFSIEGSGEVPQGFPLVPNQFRPHTIDDGSLTIGDTTLSYTGAGSAQTFTADLGTRSGTFGSGDPFVFTDADGDQLVTYYGRTDKGAAAPGEFELLSVDEHPDGLGGGDVFAHWVAEFVVQPAESTGKYAGVTGSWIMDAYSNPFLLSDLTTSGPNAGANFPLSYRWESRPEEEPSLVFPGLTGQPEVHIDLSSFENNIASSQLGHIPGEGFSGLAAGGAILNVTGIMTVDRSSFSGNSVMSGIGTGGAAKGGPAFGGAINSSNISPFGAAQSELSVRNSFFEGNVATAGAGGDTGAIGGEAAGGAILVTNFGQAELRGNTFAGNQAIGGAGVDGAQGGAATGGGVAATSGANVELRHNAFTGNSVDGGSSDGTNAGGAGRGGALGLFSVDLTGWFPGPASGSVSHSVFADNTANGVGGAIYSEGELDVTKSHFTGNEAIGEAETVIFLNPAQRSVGGAAGGAIISLGSLNVHSSRFTENRARGADDADSGNGQFANGDPVFSGGGYGGAIISTGGTVTAKIEASQFRNNIAEAGDRGLGEFAALALGGALVSDSEMTVTRSQFRGNAAIAGDNSTSPFHNGHALGGAIISGSLLPAAVPTNPGGSLVLEDSLLVNNQALGGNNNTALLDASLIPLADGPNNGYGGGLLVYQGTGTVSRSLFRGNEARAGVGGLDQNGNIGVGGGAFFFSFLGPVTAEVEHSQFIGNVAMGADGGAGIGGGIAVGTLDAPFGFPGVTSIHHTRLIRNEAVGGDGVDGGDGIGGGLAVAAGGIAELSRSAVLFNRAIGGDGDETGGDGLGGGVAAVDGGSVDIVRTRVLGNRAEGGSGGDSDGEGLGGGGYNSASATEFGLDAFSLFWMQFNSASDDGDDIFGPFSLL